MRCERVGGRLLTRFALTAITDNVPDPTHCVDEMLYTIRCGHARTGGGSEALEVNNRSLLVGGKGVV
jgi:hypothetical protein